LSYFKIYASTETSKRHQCELLRYWRNPTITICIVFGQHARNEENIQLAQKELDGNDLDREEDQIVEERKTLRWLRNELARERASVRIVSK